MTYARNTDVSVSRSKVEIESLVGRYGASQFVSGWSGDHASIGFVIDKRSIRFDLRMPERSSFAQTETGRTRRSPRVVEHAWEQACRSRWRALLLVIKAKLEAVEAGISSIDEEFMAWTVVPGSGKTIGQRLLPEIADAIANGRAPTLMLTRGDPK